MNALSWHGKHEMRVESVGRRSFLRHHPPRRVSEGPELYWKFKDREDGCIKVVMKPSQLA
jgi:hypothetical protein